MKLRAKLEEHVRLQMRLPGFVGVRKTIETVRKIYVISVTRGLPIVGSSVRRERGGSATGRARNQFQAILPHVDDRQRRPSCAQCPNPCTASLHRCSLPVPVGECGHRHGLCDAFVPFRRGDADERDRDGHGARIRRGASAGSERQAGSTKGG
ncbi:peptidase M24 [Streptomyces azureus]|uniref:Peptidase M24 n=1 Tax=Streptomyces azureus TaxID=146537 RepID=A0A0K8PH57_STRAJ|nr:peptidase M24 [Streptomyces azureus]